MGIHTWSKSATLILLVLLSICHAHAATRKYVSMPSDGQVVSSGRGSSVSGDLLTVPGNPIEGEYIPSSYGGGSKGTKLPVQPQYQYVKSRTIKGMVGNLRGGVYGAVLGIGLQYMLDSVDGMIKDNQVVVPQKKTFVPVGPNDYYWTHAAAPGSTKGATAGESCQLFVQYANTNYSPGNGRTYTQKSLTYVSDIRFTCVITGTTSSGSSTDLTDNVTRAGTQCPDGSSYVSSTGSCVGNTGQYRPATDADYDLMEAAAAAKDSEWLKERLKEHCEGSISPGKCYESLRDSVKLQGPASVTESGPTTTTTSPAGTTTTTTNTRFDIKYGDNYYDYRQTKTTIITKPDGTTETQTETEPETEQPKEQEPDPTFSDSALPQIEPFYDPIYKVGLGGVWSQRMNEIDSSPFVSFMHSFVPSFSSSCPSFSLNFNIASWANFGTISFWSLCWVFDFVKVCILVTAMFLCRAVIFGG